MFRIPNKANSRISHIGVALFGGRPFRVMDIFAGGTEGFWSDLTTGLYQDSAGTTPISAYGQGIGLVVRQAGTVNLLQTVGTAEPTYGRMPKGEQVRNLINGSDAPSTQNVTTTAAQHTLSFKGTGTITLSGTSTAGPLVGTGADDIVSLTFTPSAGALTLTISGTVTEAQLEIGAARSAYQSRVARYDITQSGIPDIPIAFFDLADDAWDSASLDAGTYTVIAVGELGCYIDEITHAGGTWTYGPTTWTGGPAAAITNLVGNRLLALGIVEGTLTAQERQQVGRWAVQAKGCPGVWELGNNLVLDPGFANAGAWTPSAGWSVVGGEVVASSAGNGNIIVVNPAIPLDVGAYYLGEFDITSYTSGSVRASSAGLGLAAFNSTGFKRAVNVASAAAIVGLQAVLAFTGQCDNLSIRKLTLNPSP